MTGETRRHETFLIGRACRRQSGGAIAMPQKIAWFWGNARSVCPLQMGSRHTSTAWFLFGWALSVWRDDRLLQAKDDAYGGGSLMSRGSWLCYIPAEL